MAAVFKSGGGSPIGPLKYSASYVQLYQYYLNAHPKFGKNAVKINKLGTTYLSLSKENAPASGVVHLNPGRNLMIRAGRGMGQLFTVRNQKMNENVLYEYVIGTPYGFIPLVRKVPIFVGTGNLDSRGMMLPVPARMMNLKSKKDFYPPFFFAITYKGKDKFKIDSCFNSSVNVILSLMYSPEVNANEVSEIMENNITELQNMFKGKLPDKEIKVTLKGEVRPLSFKAKGDEEHYLVNPNDIAGEVSIEHERMIEHNIPETNKPLPLQLYMIVKTSLELYGKRHVG